MVKIFAKQGSDEKALVVCQIDQVVSVMKALTEKYDGNWLFVDKVNPGELLHFNDGQIYRGFNPSIERYSPLIETVRELPERTKLIDTKRP